MCHGPAVAVGVVVVFLCFPPVCLPHSLFPTPAPVFLCVCICGRGSSVSRSGEAHLQIILLIIPCYIIPVSSPLQRQIILPVTVTISSTSSCCVLLCPLILIVPGFLSCLFILELTYTSSPSHVISSVSTLVCRIPSASPLWLPATRVPPALLPDDSTCLPACPLTCLLNCPLFSSHGLSVL